MQYSIIITGIPLYGIPENSLINNGVTKMEDSKRCSIKTVITGNDVLDDGQPA